MARTFQEYQRGKSEREWNDRVRKQKESMGNADRVKRATEWKRIGNEKVKAGNFFEARDYYREAIILVEDLVDARREERNELLVPLYCNLSQVYLKLGENESVEEVAGKALAIAEIPRNNVQSSFSAKAHFRRALGRRRLARLEAARDDLTEVLRLQPGSEEAAREFGEVRAALAIEQRQAREQMGGFLQREANQRERQRLREQKLCEAEQRREERRACAEQRQQMQGAFEKLSKGQMLYAAREKEMEPVRQKELEKRQTLELEQNLLNIIDGSKGLPNAESFDEFMRKKEARCEEQGSELNQKKKILDKKKKEEVWNEDDLWKGQRDDHRRRLEAERQAGLLGTRPPSLWESKEVKRWCEQRLRDMLLGTYVEVDKLEQEAVLCALGKKAQSCSSYLLRALVTDVLKLVGDAAVMQLNPHKPTLHYFDYFLKLDWEVALARKGERSYRSADELIKVAADVDDGKAPHSVVEHRVLAGTLKLRELCSEDEPADGDWPLLVKIKHQETDSLREPAQQLLEVLRSKVQRLLSRWANEYREHWA